MAGISREQKIKDYRRERKNYNERYRYWSKKIGPEHMPERVAVINVKKDNLSVKDIAKLKKMNAGYFRTYEEEFDYQSPTEEELKRLEEMARRKKLLNEVDLYYNNFINLPDVLEYKAAKEILRYYINQVVASYSKLQIAYTMMVNFEDIQTIMGMMLIYENDYYTNPKVIVLSQKLSNMFEKVEFPKDLSEEYFDEVDRDFNNAGDFGEMTEEDYM